ncbi:MAG: ABC transporter permease [Planctomycetes bacterium]|nr:ABC transporter permease [Planctomycetota bacterium]
MRAIVALVGKDLRLLTRDKGGLFFTFALPLIYAVFFGLIFSSMAGDYRSRPLPILLADEDKSEESARFTQQLIDSGEMNVERIDRKTGLERVRMGVRPVCIVIPKGFGEARRSLFSGKPTTIQLGTDPSRAAEAGMVSGLLNKHLFMGFKDAFTDPAQIQSQIEQARESLRSASDVDPASAAALEVLFAGLERFAARMPTATMPGNAGKSGIGWEPVRLEKIEIAVQRERPRNLFAVSFPQGMIWGILGCTASFGVSLVMERTRGTLRRIRTAPVGAVEILAGKSIACILTLLLICTFMLILARMAFDVVPYSLPLLAVAVVCVGLAFVGLMMLLSGFGANENSAAGISWGILTLLAMLGGGMVPLNVMPEWMRALGSVSPVKWAITAIEGALWREFSVAELAMPCAILLAFGLGSFAAGVMLLNRRSAAR